MVNMKRRKLPTGIQNFREVRERNCYYVDKTAYVQQLVTAGKHYFPSRPRRFGKRLLVDTLKELFEGNEPLFPGLGDPQALGLGHAPSGGAAQLCGDSMPSGPCRRGRTSAL